MDIVDYLEPAETLWDSIPGIPYEESLGSRVTFFQGKKNWLKNNTPEVVVIGVPEDRNGFDNRNCAKSPDAIRKLLYGLRACGSEIFIGDAGNVRGKGINDRYQALKEVTAWFLEKNMVVVIIGGTQDMTFPVFSTLTKFINNVNLVVGDAMLDLDIHNQDFSSRSWINKIIEEDNLNDLTVLGIQNYLVSQAQENYLLGKHFDLIRLGDIRGPGVSKTEAPLRDSNLVSIDLRMVKGQYQFNEKVLSPHGIEHHDACKISRYAGLSDQLKVFGLFEVASGDSFGMQNIALASQLIWHFIDGFLGRYRDFPTRNLDEYKYYVVHLEEFGDGLKFFQNQINGRWWMEVPSAEGNRVVSCNYDDYRKALRNEIPDKWWRFFRKHRGDTMETKS